MQLSSIIDLISEKIRLLVDKSKWAILVFITAILILLITLTNSIVYARALPLIGFPTTGSEDIPPIIWPIVGRFLGETTLNQLFALIMAFAEPIGIYFFIHLIFEAKNAVLEVVETKNENQGFFYTLSQKPKLFSLMFLIVLLLIPLGFAVDFQISVTPLPIILAISQVPVDTATIPLSIPDWDTIHTQYQNSYAMELVWLSGYAFVSFIAILSLCFELSYREMRAVQVLAGNPKASSNKREPLVIPNQIAEDQSSTSCLNKEVEPLLLPQITNSGVDKPMESTINDYNFNKTDKVSLLANDETNDKANITKPITLYPICGTFPEECISLEDAYRQHDKYVVIKNVDKITVWLKSYQENIARKMKT